MKLRLGMLFFVCLAFASLASAQGCLECVAGTCQPTEGGLCMKTCCGRQVGSPCSWNWQMLECPFGAVPNYFTSKLPQQAEGSRVRLQYAPAVKVAPVKCTAPAATSSRA